MDLEPNPRQPIKKITLFRPQVLKKALVLQNIKPWVYEALPDERWNVYSVSGGKCDDSIKRNTSKCICTGSQEVRCHLSHPQLQGRISFTCPSPDKFGKAEKWWAIKVYILAIKKKKKVQTKFWGCHLKVLFLALSVMDREKKITPFFFAIAFHILEDSSLICQNSYHRFCSRIGTTSFLQSATEKASNQGRAEQMGSALCLPGYTPFLKSSSPPLQIAAAHPADELCSRFCTQSILEKTRL